MKTKFLPGDLIQFKNYSNWSKLYVTTDDYDIRSTTTIKGELFIIVSISNVRNISRYMNEWLLLLSSEGNFGYSVATNFKILTPND